MLDQNAPPILLISSDDLATRMGYSGTTSAFRGWCASMRIAPVPGRRGYFDPALIRRRLDEAQGLADAVDGTAGGLVAARRARNASQ
jgi:hypothetical protein